MVSGVEERMCECGCGEMYRPVRGFQKFINNQHRQMYHNNLRRQLKIFMTALGPKSVAKILQGAN